MFLFRGLTFYQTKPTRRYCGLFCSVILKSTIWEVKMGAERKDPLSATVIGWRIRSNGGQIGDLAGFCRGDRADGGA